MRRIQLSPQSAEEIAALDKVYRTSKDARLRQQAQIILLVATVRRRPHSLGSPVSMWTLQRLADYMAQETGIRVSDETVRRYLGLAGIVLSRLQHKVSSPDPEYVVKKGD